GQLGPADMRCPTCAQITGVPVKPGTGASVLPDTGNKLTEMHAVITTAGISARITEAFPPTTTHANECHYRGTCVDYNFAPGTTPTPAQINTVLTAASGANLRGQYEVPTPEEKDALVRGGVPINRITVVDRNPPIAPHFSVYNCGADAASCTRLPQ
ncbi:MAG: hypothetical protein AAB392_00835, partial [Patescibacteria group bacterium]